MRVKRSFALLPALSLPGRAERSTRERAVIGAPPLKTPVNAKFDVDVVEWFKRQGRGYQARMNAVLRRYMEVHRKAGVNPYPVTGFHYRE